MHPVVSDLELSVRLYERELERNAIRRESIARESARIAGRSSLIDRMVSTVRQFLDPRGFALSRVRHASPGTPVRGSSSVGANSATLTSLPEAAEAESSWRDAA